MSAAPLRLLLIEDSELDAVLLLRELRQSGFDVSHLRVETSEALDRALAAESWDIIISDYSLPKFDGLSAFQQVRQRGSEVPFILVSGMIGEDMAVAAMKAGVHDFVLKDRLGRLGPAVARELREAKVRTERQRMQEQLLLSDRLSSLGLLAASVAHEINNPLASLMMDLNFALRSTEGTTVPEDGMQALRNAVECTGRIRDIVRDIKVFSRPDEQRVGPTDLHRVLDSSLRMAWNHIFHRARLTKDYGELPPVQGSEAELGQVFLNLVINAAQAIPEGQSGEHDIRVVTRLEEAGVVRVEIRDTGMGISPELRDRIFEPFFTTKPAGVGTGLGLPICRRLITKMGGTIGIESEPGRGSTFWLRLPVAQSAVEAPKQKQTPATERGLSVIIVDDEVAIGRALKRQMDKRYEVTLFTQARQALELITSGRRFDAILCDLMMPEMSGPQFHGELARLVPEQAQRVIFMTGGAFSDEARTFLSTARNPCLEKPLDMQPLFALLEAHPPRRSTG